MIATSSIFLITASEAVIWRGVGLDPLQNVIKQALHTHTHADIHPHLIPSIALLQMAILSSRLTLLTHCETKLKELCSSFFLQGHN